VRQTHLAGEKLFVDWAGDAIAVFDPITGAEHGARIFVAALARPGWRVLLARALYRQPRILFMDEGIAHLDTENEGLPVHSATRPAATTAKCLSCGQVHDISVRDAYLNANLEVQ
jgi:hypothetical protein